MRLTVRLACALSAVARSRAPPCPPTQSLAPPATRFNSIFFDKSSCRSSTLPASLPLVHAASALAACTIGAAALAADTASLGIPGAWRLQETRGGNLCEAIAEFAPDAAGALEGRVRVRSPCFDAGVGAYRVVLDGDKPTFGWALDYERSIVFYSATQVRWRMYTSYTCYQYTRAASDAKARQTQRH